MPTLVVPPVVRIQVELMKLGRTRMGLRIPVQEGFPRGFYKELVVPNSGTYSIRRLDSLQLNGTALYIRGIEPNQPSLSTYAYGSQGARDEAYTIFLQLLTQANQGVDPRVEVITIQPPSTEPSSW